MVCVGFLFFSFRPHSRSRTIFVKSLTPLEGRQHSGRYLAPFFSNPALVTRHVGRNLMLWGCSENMNLFGKRTPAPPFPLTPLSLSEKEGKADHIPSTIMWRQFDGH